MGWLTSHCLRGLNMLGESKLGGKYDVLICILFNNVCSTFLKGLVGEMVFHSECKKEYDSTTTHTYFPKYLLYLT